MSAGVALAESAPSGVAKSAYIASFSRVAVLLNSCTSSNTPPADVTVRFSHTAPGTPYMTCKYVGSASSARNVTGAVSVRDAALVHRAVSDAAVTLDCGFATFCMLLQLQAQKCRSIRKEFAQKQSNNDQMR